MPGTDPATDPDAEADLDVPPFPPPRHAISLLEVDVEMGPGSDVRGWMPVTTHVVTPSGGPSLGPLCMLLDIVAGTSAVIAADLDQVFTADMSIHLLPGVRVTEVASHAHVRRRGRRTLVQQIDLQGPSGEQVGWGTTTFVIARRRANSPDLADHRPEGRQRFWPLGPDEPPARYREELELRLDGPGQVSVDLRWQVANNVGALNGGVQAAMIDEAAASLVRGHLGPTTETTDAHIAFLHPGLEGPLRAVASLVGEPAPGGDRVTVEVRVLDADGVLCTFATTEVVAA